ncbi:MAG: UDP-2,3-diacylglucosamine diphosphatase LpxI [Parvibaculum sp.]
MTTPEENAKRKGSSLGILAGRGPLPLAVADAAASQGRRVFIIGIIGRSDKSIERHPHAWVRYGALGKTLELLRREECRELILIGPLDRPKLFQFWPDWGAIKVLPDLLKLLRQGDDGLLSGVVRYFEEEHGFLIRPAEVVAAELAAPGGLQTSRAPTERDMIDVHLAVEIARTHGAEDLGQGAIVADGIELAREASDGTDAMLKRVAAERSPSSTRSGVLVKLPKPGQERRVDLPTLGVQTVENAAAAGLSGIAYEAGGALIADHASVVARANDLGLFVLGLPPGTSERAT